MVKFCRRRCHGTSFIPECDRTRRTAGRGCAHYHRCSPACARSSKAARRADIRYRCVGSHSAETAGPDMPLLQQRGCKRTNMGSPPVNIDSLLLALAGGWAEAPTCAHALPESFPLLGRHVRATLLHALLHATAYIGAARTVPSMSAEEDPA